ncbi:dystonin-like [Seriola lalandi dorsalis]|uniref:dystonin-like n=1 Tax=Seriola lalandi dorsalis TaxID=1841481 RepID=UPI000C6FB761|nr:dystonin-like [Seriola lalandi dorsalis]
MEEPANRRSETFTSQNSSVSSLDYSDQTLSLPALPTSEASGMADKESALFGSPTPTSQDQRYGTDVEDLSQWQSEFRSQIRALRQWLKSMEMRLPPLDPRLEQAVVKEMAWFRDTALSLEKLKTINLDSELIAEQLYEQKILAVEILQHRFNIEKMVKIAEILLTYSDEGEMGDLRTPIDVLQEQCNTTSATNSHVVLQLEHAQSLLLQFSESLAEVSPWLEETQTLIGQLSLSTISYEAFREQQDLLQGKCGSRKLQTAKTTSDPGSA